MKALEKLGIVASVPSFFSWSLAKILNLKENGDPPKLSDSLGIHMAAIKQPSVSSSKIPQIFHSLCLISEMVHYRSVKQNIRNKTVSDCNSCVFKENATYIPLEIKPERTRVIN